MFLLAFVIGSAKIAQSLRVETNATYGAEVNWGQACFGAKGSNPGEFTIPFDTNVTSIVLEHVNGSVACSGDSAAPSAWGCSCLGCAQRLGTFMTDASNTIMFPTSDAAGMVTYGTPWYYMDGSAGLPQDPTLTWAQPASIPAGQYRLWYGEDLINEPGVGSSEADNVGTTCATIKAYVTYVATPSPTSDEVSGTGDPHLSNLRGEHFDVYQAGSMALIHVPRRAEPARTLLLVEAEARHMGDACSVYFQVVSISGKWTNQSTPIQFFAGPHGTPEEDERKNWMRFGTMDLKVVRRKKGVYYLNVYARKVSHSGYEVGGLLGLDDHKDVAQRPRQCTRRHAAVLVSSVAQVD